MFLLGIMARTSLKVSCKDSSPTWVEDMDDKDLPKLLGFEKRRTPLR
jgi:hypothetical protein